MIQYVYGDLFESPAQTLVNTVNTVGVMGKGIALTFKKLYPDMFAAYQRACEEGRFSVGSLFLWRTPAKLIVNFPTKQDWRRPSRPEYIEAGLKTFVDNYQDIGISSIAFPPLGCGNGELDFATQVQPLMERYLADLPLTIYIYAPLPRSLVPEHRSIDEIRTWLRQEPRALAFSEFWDDLRDVLAHQRIYHTLKQGTRVEAVYLEDQSQIRVKASGKSYTFGQEDICELWRELRDHMILTPQSLPVRAKQLGYLFPVLAEVEYLDVIRLAASVRQLSTAPTYGLRLLPAKVSRQQRELALA